MHTTFSQDSHVEVLLVCQIHVSFMSGLTEFYKYLLTSMPFLKCHRSPSWLSLFGILHG